MPTPSPYRQVDGYSPSLTGPVRALPWADEALCAQVDPDLFFEQATSRYEHVTGKQASERISAAKGICRRCPVMRQCRDYAMAHPELEGIWGAMTEKERRQWRRRQDREVGA